MKQISGWGPMLLQQTPHPETEAERKQRREGLLEYGAAVAAVLLNTRDDCSEREHLKARSQSNKGIVNMSTSQETSTLMVLSLVSKHPQSVRWLVSAGATHKHLSALKQKGLLEGRDFPGGSMVGENAHLGLSAAGEAILASISAPAT